MQWLNLVDTLVVCKRGLVYCIKPNGFIFELIGISTPLFSIKQLKKWVQKDEKLFTISVHKPINEPVNEDGLNEMVGKLLETYPNVFFAKLLGLPPTKEIDH